MQYNHEVIVPNEDLPIKMFLFEGKEGNYFRDRHWHRSIEIFAVFKGSLTFYLNDIEQQLHPGEFVIVNSNEIHAIDAPYPNQTVVIQMALKTFQDYFTEEQYIRFTHEPMVQDMQGICKGVSEKIWNAAERISKTKPELTKGEMMLRKKDKKVLFFG